MIKFISTLIATCGMLVMPFASRAQQVEQDTTVTASEREFAQKLLEVFQQNSFEGFKKIAATHDDLQTIIGNSSLPDHQKKMAMTSVDTIWTDKKILRVYNRALTSIQAENVALTKAKDIKINVQKMSFYGMQTGGIRMTFVIDNKGYGLQCAQMTKLGDAWKISSAVDFFADPERDIKEAGIQEEPVYTPPVVTPEKEKKKN